MGKLDCRGILRTMSDYISGDLGKSVCQDIETHLTTCRRCRFHVDAVRFTINLYDEWRGEEMPQDAEIRLRDRLQAETDCFIHSPLVPTRKKTDVKKAARKKPAAKKTARKKTGAKKAARKKPAAKKPTRKKTAAKKAARKKPAAKKPTRR